MSAFQWIYVVGMALGCFLCGYAFARYRLFAHATNSPSGSVILAHLGQNFLLATEEAVREQAAQNRL